MHLPVFPENRPHLSDLIKASGPSKFGWHAVSLGMRCDKLAYYSLVKKLRSKTPSEALDFGVLTHACLEAHYKTGGRDTYKPILEIKDTLPEMALKAEKLIEAYIKRYGQQEALTWDIRDVEVEHGFKVKGGKFGDYPFTCRYDLITAFKEPDQAPRPFGPVSNGCTIVESKCLVGSTKVYDANSGRLRTLQDLFETNDKPKLLGFDSKTLSLKWVEAETINANGIQRVLQLRTEHGREITLSENHPLYTPIGWKCAGDLSMGDWIATPKQIQFNDKCKSLLTKDQVRWLSLMLGDGSFKDTLKFTNTDSNVLTEFIQILERFGYVRSTRTGGGPGNVKHVKPKKDDPLTYCIQTPNKAHSAHEIRMSIRRDSPLRMLSEQLGLYGCVSATKFIPDEVFNLSDDLIRCFLGGLWSTDGFFTIAINKKESGTYYNPGVKLGSRSRDLVAGTQRLLLRLGIPSSIEDLTIEYKGTERPYYYVSIISAEAKDLFCRDVIEGRIPVSLLYRVDKAKECLRYTQDAIKNGSRERIPIGLLSYIHKERPLGKFGHRYNSDLFERRGALLRCSLEKLNSEDPHPSAERALNAEIRWEKVTNVLSLPAERTYDVTVPELHSFVANDIVVHNTASMLSRDLVESFGFDPQLLSQALIWKKANLNKVYGPLNGFIVNILVKTKIPQFERLEIKLEDRDLDRFEEVLKTNLKRIHLKLRRDAHDETKWPLNLSACHQRFGKCQFWDLCSSHDSLIDMYETKPPSETTSHLTPTRGGIDNGAHSMEATEPKVSNKRSS